MDILLGAISGAKTIQLVTYKRDGTAVATPVSVAVAGDRAFFRTYDQAGKARRLRRDPRVEVAPATFRGRVTGPGAPARAVLLDSGQAAVAARALARRHRLLQAVLVPLAHRLRGYRTLHYELLPAPR
jgi:PPOX class probable F420-dependent enzyme